MASPQRALTITGLSAVGAALFCPSPAVAQDAAEMADITVTAQLRPQKSIDIPMAATVLSGVRLNRFGIADLNEAARQVPGVVVQNQSPNDPGFVIRGITSDTGAAYDEPRVSVLQDGISISRSRGAYVELFDVDRIEIDKGPQTTLYGRGALIGAINILQNKADPKAFAAMASLSYGNFDRRTGELMVNAPLSDTVALRVAGRIRKADGYVGNLLGGPAYDSDDTRAARASLHLETGALSVDLIGNYQKDTPSGTSFKSISYLPTDPVTGAVIGDTGRNSGAALASAAGLAGNQGLGVDRTLWSGTLLATLTISDSFDLVSLSGYRHFSTAEIFDVDGLSLPLLSAAEYTHSSQISQELRLRYALPGFTGVFGASWFHERGSQRTPTQFDERMALARLAGALNGGGAIPGRPSDDPAPAGLFDDTEFTGALVGAVAGAAGATLDPAQARALAANLRPDYLESATNDARTNAFDIFGDTTIKLAPRLEFGLGLRWSHDAKQTGYQAAVAGGRSVLGGLLAALTLPAPLRDALLGALAVPGAATIPPSPAYPVPLFGLGVQPTGANGTRYVASLHDSGLSWRMTARFELSPTMAAYADYARGRRPKVLAASPPSLPGGAAGFAILPNERVDSIEAGLKARAAGGRLVIDAGFYHYRYANFQTIIQQGTQLVTVNAGRAGDDGLEIQLDWRASRMLSAFASYSYSHGRFLNGPRTGNHFRLNPDHAAAAGMVIEWPIRGGTVSLAPSLSWQSKIFFDDNNDRPDLQGPGSGVLVPDTEQDELQRGYALVNARLAWNSAKGLTVEGFVTNMLNRKYIKDAGNSGDAIGLPTFIAGEPRFYGLRVVRVFGRR